METDGWQVADMSEPRSIADEREDMRDASLFFMAMAIAASNMSIAAALRRIADALEAKHGD